jgi:hypothetical protein
MVVDGDVLSLKPVLDLGLDAIVRHAECQLRLFQRCTRVRSQHFIDVDVNVIDELV